VRFGSGQTGEGSTQPAEPHRSSWVKWALHGVGLILLAYIVTRIDLRHTARILIRQNTLLLLGTLALFLPQAALRIWRWSVILRTNGCRIPFALVRRTVLTGMFWGIVTPGKVGEFAKASLLKRVGCSWGLAMGLTTLDRLFDVTVVLVVGAASVALVGTAAYSRTPIWVFLAVGLLGLGAGAGLRRRWRDMFGRLPWVRKYRERLGSEFSEFTRVLGSPAATVWLRLTTVTLLLWLLAYVEVYLFAFNLGIRVSFPYLVATVACGTLLNLLPITVSGVGTRDAAYILLLGSRGICAESAVALSTMVLFMFLVNGFICYFAVLVDRRGDRT